MTADEQVQRYKSCAHKGACDRMARLASLMIWFASEVDPNESVASAYRCELCQKYERSNDDDD